MTPDLVITDQQGNSTELVTLNRLEQSRADHQQCSDALAAMLAERHQARATAATLLRERDVARDLAASRGEALTTLREALTEQGAVATDLRAQIDRQAAHGDALEDAATRLEADLAEARAGGDGAAACFHHRDRAVREALHPIRTTLADALGRNPGPDLAAGVQQLAAERDDALEAVTAARERGQMEGIDEARRQIRDREGACGCAGGKVVRVHLDHCPTRLAVDEANSTPLPPPPPPFEPSVGRRWSNPS